jgi:putative nucleotidyltransferase with HDIG domain
MRNRFSVYAFVLVVVVCAAWLLDTLLQTWALDAELLLTVVAFAAFVTGIEFLEVRTSDGFRWAPSSTVDHAAWMLFGPVAAMLIRGLAIVVGDGFVRRRPPLRVLFNTATGAIAVGLAGATFHALPWSDDLSSPAFLVPAVLSHLVFALVNNLLATVVMALSEAKRLDEVARTVFGWHFLTGVGAAPLSAFLVFSYGYAGLWSLILFVIPLLIIYQAHRLFEQMNSAHKETVAALTTALEADEPYTHGHSYRVAKYAVQIGRHLGLSPRELETLEYAGLLHDIGKIAITNDIVCKPSRLSKDEFDILSAHPAIGSEIVEKMKFLEDAADLVRHHHERPDGQGYPDGLKGDEISLGSHILNLCDAIDAMCSNRPYRAALTLEQCVAEVERFRGSQFDARVVDTFVSLVRQGNFDLIEQSDDTALEIQRIVRDAAAKSKKKESGERPVFEAA